MVSSRAVCLAVLVSGGCASGAQTFDDGALTLGATDASPTDGGGTGSGADGIDDGDDGLPPGTSDPTEGPDSGETSSPPPDGSGSDGATDTAGTTGDPGSEGSGTTSDAGDTSDGGSSDGCVASAEECNGLDDDCDGLPDNGDPGGGSICNTGLPGICSAGTTVCSGGAIDCEQNDPAAPAEICGNLADDDCNGAPDDGCGTICVDDDLGSGLPASATGSNAGFGNDLAATCGGGGGEEHVYSWTAPYAGTFHVSTAGSSYDTLLTIHDGCTGGELQCNDDFYGVQSGLDVVLAAGQAITIGADGFSGATGTYNLNITGNLGCFEVDLGSTSPQTYAGSTVGADNDVTAGCGGGGGPDVLHRFIAPSAGVYTFDTIGSPYDTILFATYCQGPELACNDDFSGLQSSISVALAAGQPVLIGVDGYAGGSGNYTLNVAGP